MEPTDDEAAERERKPWTEPTLRKLEMSRTSNNPSTGGDGGTGDCQNS